MPRYCVQVIRTYQAIAEDEERAEEIVLEMERRGGLDTAPICNVTDLDALAAFVRAGADQPEGGE